MSDDRLIHVSLEVFDLHNELHRGKLPFQNCPDAWCKNARETVLAYALGMLAENRIRKSPVREVPPLTVTAGPTVKLRANGSDWIVTDRNAACEFLVDGRAHTLGAHLPGGTYEGFALDHAPPPCSAHADSPCKYCSRPGGAENGHCDQCSTYDAYGWHWDTCSNRDNRALQEG